MRSDGRPSVIRVKCSPNVRHEERVASGSTQAGKLLMLAAGGVKNHNLTGGRAERIFADLDTHRGRTIDTSLYTSGDQVMYCQPRAGDVVQGWLAQGQSVVIDEPLISNGDGNVTKALFVGGGLLYNSVAESAEHENTTTAANFDKSFSIPANTLQVGDVLRIRANVTVNDNNSTDTLTLLLTIGGTTIVTTGAVDVADGDIGFMDVLVTIRTIGASGTMVASGLAALGVPGTVTGKAVSLASTAIDTTVANVVAVNADWSVAHADNEASLTQLTIERLGAAGAGGGVDNIVAFAGETLDNDPGTGPALIRLRIA